MILKETKNNIEKFTEIYEKDRYLARVFALEKTPSIFYIVLNEVSNSQFQIFYTTHIYGVSKTLKRYITRKTTKKYFVNNGRFFIQERGKILPLSACQLDKESGPLFRERFTWIRFLEENGFYNVTFNTITRYKLYSREKVLRHIYKCPPEKALIIKNSQIENYEWKAMSKVCYNAENINPEILNDLGFLKDCCALAYKLNEVINLSWSVRRLKEEHDKWSKIFTKIIIELDNEPLNNRDVFIDLNDFLGGGLLTQSGQLANEGYKQNHCVATYKSKINSGRCAIFNINGYTAEIAFSNHRVYLNQFKGYRNIQAPLELTQEINNKISEFNKNIEGKDYLSHSMELVLVDDLVDLPF